MVHERGVPRAHLLAEWFPRNAGQGLRYGLADTLYLLIQDVDDGKPTSSGLGCRGLGQHLEVTQHKVHQFVYDIPLDLITDDSLSQSERGPLAGVLHVKL